MVFSMGCEMESGLVNEKESVLVIEMGHVKENVSETKTANARVCQSDCAWAIVSVTKKVIGLEPWTETVTGSTTGVRWLEIWRENAWGHD
jgi:hypothetical protein